jgi:hypothetical protein
VSARKTNRSKRHLIRAKELSVGPQDLISELPKKVSGIKTWRQAENLHPLPEVKKNNTVGIRDCFKSKLWYQAFLAIYQHLLTDKIYLSILLYRRYCYAG